MNPPPKSARIHWDQFQGNSWLHSTRIHVLSNHILYLSSSVLHLVSFKLHLESFIVQLVSFKLHLASCIFQFASCKLYLLSIGKTKAYSSKRADMSTCKVTSSLLELLVPAKNAKPISPASNLVTNSVPTFYCWIQIIKLGVKHSGRARGILLEFANWFISHFSDFAVEYKICLIMVNFLPVCTFVCASVCSFLRRAFQKKNTTKFWTYICPN